MDMLVNLVIHHVCVVYVCSVQVFDDMGHAVSMLAAHRQYINSPCMICCRLFVRQSVYLCLPMETYATFKMCMTALPSRGYRGSCRLSPSWRILPFSGLRGFSLEVSCPFSTLDGLSAVCPMQALHILCQQELYNRLFVWRSWLKVYDSTKASYLQASKTFVLTNRPDDFSLASRL